jgi:hypothetical protein
MLKLAPPQPKIMMSAADSLSSGVTADPRPGPARRGQATDMRLGIRKFGTKFRKRFNSVSLYLTELQKLIESKSVIKAVGKS